MEILESIDLTKETLSTNGSSSSQENGTLTLTQPLREETYREAQSAVEAPLAPTPIFALGRINPQFPSLAVEKEFLHAASQIQSKGMGDYETRHAVLSAPQNRYLLRQLCWVFSVEGLETYILQPQNPADYDLLVEAIRPTPDPSDVDVVIGMRGSLAAPELCNGLMVPIVTFDQIYSFDREQLIASIPRPESWPKNQMETFRIQAGELFDRMIQMADNAGATDDVRALNFLAVRYPVIYAKAADMFSKSFSLSSIETHSSRLSGARKVMDVIFTYIHRQTDVDEKYFVRVDVTEEFPFLITKLTQYFNR